MKMSWKRALFLATGAIWGVMLAVALWRRGAAVAARLPEAFAPRAARAAFESGNPPFQQFLETFGRSVPAGGTVLLLVRDPSGQAMYHSYRSCFDLYPTRVRAFPVGFTPPGGKRFTMKVDDRLLALVQDERIAIAGFFAQDGSAPARLFAVAPAGGGELAFTSAEFGDARADVPRVPPPARSWAWPLGAASLLGVGWAANAAAGVAGPFGRDVVARLGLAWFTGAGLTALLLFLLSLAGVPWSLPLVAGLAAAIAGGGWWLARSRAPAAPAPPAPRPPLPWDERAGALLLVAAALLAVVQSLLPQNAWWNWDGWAQYDFKARVFFAARGVPLGFLQDPLYQFTNQAYPCGFQIVQAVLGFWSGGIGTPWLRMGSTLYYLALLAILSHLIADLGARRHRWLLTALLAHVPTLVTQASDGYMDLLVGSAMVAVLAVLAKAVRGGAPLWHVAWFAGCAAFLKDEGMSFGVFALAVLALAVVLRRATWQAFGTALAVLALTAGPWRLLTRALDIRLKDWKFSLGYLFDNLATTGPKTAKAVFLELIADGPSMANVGGPWNSFTLAGWWEHLIVSWLPLWFAVLLGLAIGWKAFRASPFRELGLLLLMQQSVHGVFYLMTILNLDFHLVTSVYRRALQAAPGFLALAAAAWVKSMEAPPVPVPPPEPPRGGKRR